MFYRKIINEITELKSVNTNQIQIKITLICCFLFSFFAPCDQLWAAGTWLNDYSYRVKIPIAASSDGSIADYQKMLVVHSKSGTNTAGDIYLNGNLQDLNGFNDIRFTGPDKLSQKKFWIQKIENETGGNKATVWVKVDSPSSGTTDYYLYYGKADDATFSSYDETFTKDYGETGLAGSWHFDEMPGQEVLNDGDFESWASTADLVNWTEYGTSVGVRDLLKETTNKQTSTSSLKLMATAAGGTEFGIYQDIATTKGAKYQVNFYQHFFSRTTGTLKVEAWDNTNLVSLGSQVVSTSGSSLSFVSFRFISNNTTNVRIKVYLTGETTGGAYVDSLSVKASSDTTVDSSGNNNTGTIYGASRTSIDGGYWGSSSTTIFATGSALQLDGVNDYVDAGNGASLNATTSFSVEAWVKPFSDAYQHILSKQNSSGPNNGYGWALRKGNSSAFQFYIYQDNSNRSLAISSSPSTLGVFQHVAGVYNGSTITCYTNGVPGTPQAVTGFGLASTTNFVIGSYAPSTALVMNGVIDEIRYYNRALSGDEIARYYQRSKFAVNAPSWSSPGLEEQGGLKVTTQDASFVTLNGATLNATVSGLGGDDSVKISFAYGLSKDDLVFHTVSQSAHDYGGVTQTINSLSPDTTYFYRAEILNSSASSSGSIMSFRTAAFDTAYYRVIINDNGSLSFLNKDTGVSILDNASLFNLNYGSYSLADVALANNSFEADTNSDNIPDGWAVDKSYIRLSSEQASTGSNSVRFEMANSDYDHRRLTSSLLQVTPDRNYTISFDSYVSSLTSGRVTGYVLYYTTTDGSGTAYTGANNAQVPATIGSWKHSSFTWVPPANAKSFRVFIMGVYNSKGIVYIDNIGVSEKTFSYSVNGTVNHNIDVSGDTIKVTTVDDTNSSTTVKQQYELNSNSPFVRYSVTLGYKSDVDVTEERFDFTVPTNNAKILTRDLQLKSFTPTESYWSDLYTPKVVKFNNGIYFLGSDTMEAMRLRASSTVSQLSFYSDFSANHPHSDSRGSTNETKRRIGDSYSAQINFAINPYVAPKILVKTRQPYGYDATLVMTNHPDAETTARIKAIAYGTEDETDTSFGTKGIIGHGINWTRSVFVSGQPGADLQDPDFKAQVDKMYNDGVEIIGHSITPNTDSRSVVASGLEVLEAYHSKNWIDHGSADNSEVLGSHGAIKGDSNYILDILDQHNYQYAWSYVDLLTTSNNLNILQPANTYENRPFLYYNNQIDDDVTDDHKIYLWSTLNLTKTPDLYYATDHVDSLIAERGVHVAHDYYGYVASNNHSYYTNPSSSKVEIYPMFDSELAYISEKKSEGLLWNPTLSGMGDYLVSLKDVLITYNLDNTYTVKNNSLSTTTGITLLAEDALKSVKVDGATLMLFGESYGDNELVLPPLAPGQSINLDLTYGDKDVSIPTISSKEISKDKINEITGIWDSVSKVMTMTASGKGSHSFTVTIPSLANKSVAIKDLTSGINIGIFTATVNGAITFSASLGSTHTFSIQEDSGTGIEENLTASRSIINLNYSSSKILGQADDGNFSKENKKNGRTVFKRNLLIGSTGRDVKELQIFLNTHGFKLASMGPGSPGQETNKFGNLTKKALIKFQEKYSAIILNPVKLKKGTGFFGSSTRNYINSFSGKH